ncbi:hypothetical protein GT037_006589 [Alternaria burnsii]|uniref:Uncharacterized protein n=1 Tax=Alternaria burnsii TaxID=1187904 RepID=A0A8H7EEQ6_9PLEO|nr:uncharacterized protein GT037_006589 [Alternaria burnsii]KAF7675870.1 hypothetical protein GT037_006589 [Alternaria burnsii]
MAPPIKYGRSSSNSNHSNLSNNGSKHPAGFQSAFEPVSQIAAAPKPAKRKKSDVTKDAYIPPSSSPPPDTQTKRKPISNTEMRALGIPTRESMRKHAPITLPLDDDATEAAKAEVRPYNTEYRNMLNNYGYASVIDLAYKDARDENHPFMSPTKTLSQLKIWRRYGLLLLASSELDVLKCLYAEGIAPNINTNDSLRRLYTSPGGDMDTEWVQRYNQAFAPCIYVRELVNKDQTSPTHAEARRAIQLLREYVSGDDEFAGQNAEIDRLCWQSDSAEDDIKQGYHFFLEGRWQRAAKIITFCTALDALLSDAGGIMDDLPLPWKLKYVGYAKSASHRISSYNGDRSQSWFSGLLRNIFQYLYPDQGFQLVTHVVAFCVCYEECQIGEELLSRSAQAYYNTGTGMGVTPAGCNVSSANTEDMSAKDAKRLWALAMGFRLRGEFDRNMARDMEDLPVYEEYQKPQTPPYDTLYARRRPTRRGNSKKERRDQDTAFSHRPYRRNHDTP